MDKEKKYFLIYIIFTICIVQIIDAYSTEIFSKMQSFILDEFLFGKDETTAISILNMAVIPFYAFSILGMLVRYVSDRLGYNFVMAFTLILMLAGCFICMKSTHLIVFLLGTGFITLATTIDMQYLYIVRFFPEEKRASIRGLLGGLATFSAIMLSVARKYLVNGKSWKIIYLPPLVITFLILLIIVFNTLYDKNDYEKSTKSSDTLPESIFERKNVSAKSDIKSALASKKMRRYLFLYILFGIGTAGITLYNEPLIKLSGADESGMFVVLFAQPVALMLITFLGGMIGDHVSRKKAIILNSILAIISLMAFILISKNPASLKQGFLWGAMTALYYNAEAVFQLVILETAKPDCIGRIAAISTFFYGVGDGMGMIIANSLTEKLGIITAKCIVTIPVLSAVSIGLMLCKNSKSQVVD